MTSPNTRPANLLSDALAQGDIQTSWAHYAPMFEALQRADLSAAGVPSWLGDWSQTLKAVAQSATVLSLRADLNTADAEAKAALTRFRAEVLLPTQQAEQALRQKLLAVPEYLPAPDFALAYRRMKDAAAFYREANAELEVTHADQMQRHGEISGSQSVEFDGSALTVPEAEALLGSADRTRREQVWQAMSRSRAETRLAFDALILELIATRRQLAANAELADYRAYAWQQLDRVDYTPQDCLDFHAAVQAEVVPLASELMRGKAQQLGLEAIKPWDYSRRTALDAQARPPLTPFQTVGELESIAERVFDALDPALGASFSQMRTGGLLDLASRPHKMTHAYCESLQVSDAPFVVMNVVGTAHDVGVLLHEMGHAFHFFASARAQPLVWNRWSPLEFIEVPSMAMEYLALSKLEAVYLPAELERVKREQLEGSLLFLPWAAQMDAFQHWLYTETGPNVTTADLDAKWLELDRTFHPWIDWSGLDEGERASGWQYYHIFRAPFYYLEYAMCSLGALGLWQAFQHDAPATLEQYKSALSLGNTVSLPQLYQAAGLEFRFDREYVAERMAFVKVQLSDAG